MLSSLKEYSFYLVVSIFLVVGSLIMKSDFLARFLLSNLVTLLVALLAINTTTSSVVMTKLKEISDKKPKANFSATILELKKSMTEQIAYVSMAIFFSILAESVTILSWFEYASTLIAILLTTIFVAALGTLYDTGRSIFVILSFENKSD